MPFVIDAKYYMQNKKKLPVEAFFVDTNVIIEFLDPFSRSASNSYYQKRNEELYNNLHYFRSIGYKNYSTVVSCIEYYKHIQWNMFRIRFPQEQYSTREFKRKLTIDNTFNPAWESQLKVFNKAFERHFPLHESSLDQSKLIGDFSGMNVDYGDYVIYKIVSTQKKEQCAVFSNDHDFYNFPNDFILITIEDKIIEQAEKDGKLLRQ